MQEIKLRVIFISIVKKFYIYFTIQFQMHLVKFINRLDYKKHDINLEEFEILNFEINIRIRKIVIRKID